MTSSTIQHTQNEQSNRIKKLPPLLVNQLAAGEVVTRPASVVKELIENAIDAGAQCITVRIMQGGMDSIEVVDDGCGIHADDMMMAVTRFATSKIADVGQLQGIATLGFRGEALAATAAVSRLTLRSSSDDSGVGRELMVAGILEDTPTLLPVVQPKGTTVIVKDLYFNVPARRGNLKSIATEFAHIEAVVKQLALAASDVEISLWHNDKRRFHFTAVNGNNTDASLPMTHSGSSLMQSAMARLKMILPNIFGSYSDLHSNLKSLHAIDEPNIATLSLSFEGLIAQDTRLNTLKSSDIGVTGYLVPQFEISNNTHKLIYINGRLVKDKRIAQSMRNSMSSLPTLADVGYVLFFRLPQNWLNVNVHPSKQSIKIQNLPNITAHLEQSVKNSLQSWFKKQDNLSKLSASQAVSTAISNPNQTIQDTRLSNHIRAGAKASNKKGSSQYNRHTNDVYTNTNNTQYASRLLNHRLNEKQQVYQRNITNGLGQNFNKEGVDSNFPSDDYYLNDSHIENSQIVNRHTDDTIAFNSNHKQLAKPRTAKSGIECLARLLISQIDVDVESLLADREGKLSLNSSVILLQYHARLYLFEESILLEAIVSRQNVDIGEYAALIDSEKLGWLTDYLEVVLTTDNEKEQNGLTEQALAVLSFNELTTLMLQSNIR